MENWQIILSFLFLILAFFILRYSINARHEKGNILSSAYFALSEEERERFDKKKEYQRLSVFYGLIGIFFVLLSFCILTLSKVFAFACMGVLLADLIYAAVQIAKNRA